jgi:hypothetical protein
MFVWLKGVLVRCSIDRSICVCQWVRVIGCLVAWWCVCGRLCVFCERCVCVLVQNTISVLWLCGGLVVKSCASLRKANEISVIRFLLEHRADVNIMSRDGKKPQDSTQRLALVVHRSNDTWIAVHAGCMYGSVRHAKLRARAVTSYVLHSGGGSDGRSKGSPRRWRHGVQQPCTVRAAAPSEKPRAR